MELTKRKEKKRKNERKCSPASNKLENQRSGNTESLEGLRSEAVKKKKKKKRRREEEKWRMIEKRIERFSLPIPAESGSVRRRDKIR